MKLNLDKVPATVLESVQMFLESLDEEEKTALKDVEENQIAIFHHTWGQQMRNDWSLWEKENILNNSFKLEGVTHPDDITGIILLSAHRTLNKKPVKLKEQAAYYQDFWKKEIGKPMP